MLGVLMKRTLLTLFVLGLAGCVHRPGFSDLSIRDIEEMAFMDAYYLWRQQTSSNAKKNLQLRPDVLVSDMLIGTSDPKTGKFTPTRLSALQCRLGQEAHLHE